MHALYQLRLCSLYQGTPDVWSCTWWRSRRWWIPLTSRTSSWRTAPSCPAPWKWARNFWNGSSGTVSETRSVCVCIGLSVSYSVVFVVNNGLHDVFFGILQVTRIVLLWVNNHFKDFEGDPVMTLFLEDFEKLLDSSVSVDIRQNQTDSIKQGSYGREKQGNIRHF